MRHQVGISVRTFVNHLQPIEIMPAVTIDDAVPSGERRIADDNVEPGIVPEKDLRELQLPVERVERLLPVTNGCHSWLKAVLPAGAAQLQGGDNLLSGLFSRLQLFRGEKRG